jgi:hypothetical protein
MLNRHKNDHPLDTMRARAEQVRRLVGMTDDPELAMNLRCCAQGLNADIERLEVELHGGARSQRHQAAA